MSITPKFCTSCGTPLPDGARFCGQCGAAVQAIPASNATPAPATPPPAAVPSEPILGMVLGLNRRKGFLGMSADAFNLVITPQCLVFAFMSKKTMQDAVMAARREAKEQGKGALGQWAAQMGWLGVMARRYQSMTPDEILAQYPGSFVIPRAEVKRVRVDESDDDDGPSITSVVVETQSGRHAFQASMMSGGASQIQKALREALGSIVK